MSRSKLKEIRDRRNDNDCVTIDGYFIVKVEDVDWLLDRVEELMDQVEKDEAHEETQISMATG
jgi:hypothetical protein